MKNKFTIKIPIFKKIRNCLINNSFYFTNKFSNVSFSYYN